MHFLKKLTTLALALTLGTTVLLATPAPTQEQIDEFTRALTAAWKTGDPEAFIPLYVPNTLPPGSWLEDMNWDFWADSLQSAKRYQSDEEPSPGSPALQSIEFKPLEEAKKTKSYGITPESIKLMTQGFEINGRSYRPSPPAIGLINVTVMDGFSLPLPVGLDASGKLKITTFIPAPGYDPKLYTFPPPIPVQGIAKEMPAQEAIECFIDETKKKPLHALIYTKGMPTDMIDHAECFNPAINALLGPDVKDAKEVMFIPYEEAIKNDWLTFTAEKATEIRAIRNRWYGPNLPIVGIVQITFVSGASTNAAVGITPEGELRIPGTTLVTPPQPPSAGKAPEGK